MPVTLVVGPHAAGKSRAVMRRLRTAGLGRAVLVRPAAGFDRDAAGAAFAWGGPGLLPPVTSFASFIDELAADAGVASRVLDVRGAAHALRRWCRHHLADSPFARVADLRSTAAEFAELCLRLDDHGMDQDRLSAAIVAAESAGDQRLGVRLRWLSRARQGLHAAARRAGRLTPGQRVQQIAAADPAPRAAVIGCDDFLALTPVEVALLRAVGRQRDVLITAVEDPRLRGEGLAERLRVSLPEAVVDRLPAEADGSRPAGLRALWSVLLDDADERPVENAATDLRREHIGYYRYRDATHAGRALAAWLRCHGIAPGSALVALRRLDADALAFADALIAAGVPVQGRFAVPLLATPLGGALAALASYLDHPTMDGLIALAERLPLVCAPGSVAGLATPLPVPARELRCGEGLQDPEIAFAALSAIAEGDRETAFAWQGGDIAVLAQAIAALRALRDQLRELSQAERALADAATAEGATETKTAPRGAADFATRFTRCVLGLGLTHAASEAGAAATWWPEFLALCELDPPQADEVAALLAGQSVEVVREPGSADGAAERALALVDAVRGRSQPRDVVIVQGLEHGAWPPPPSSGALFPREERRRLAVVLGSDLFAEAEREAGERASLLAVLARARSRLVFGIPCGEREPSAYLAAIADAAGLDLDALRRDSAGEAVPGAPLGLGDSQGAHERALWSRSPGRPSFRFRVPPCAPRDLRLRASSLNGLIRDSFSAVCARLHLGPALSDAEAMREGDELHALLAELAPLPRELWASAVGTRLAAWCRAAGGAYRQTLRRLRAARIVAAIADEAQHLRSTPLLRCEPEVDVRIDLPVPGHEALRLRGRIDRLDVLPGELLRVVDYKRGRIGSWRTAIQSGDEGQLLAYLLGAQALGTPIGAYYLGLSDSQRFGYGLPLSGSAAWPSSHEVAARIAELGAAIARLAEGEAIADASAGADADYAAIARLDEARLDLAPRSEQGDDDA